MRWCVTYHDHGSELAPRPLAKPMPDWQELILKRSRLFIACLLAGIACADSDSNRSARRSDAPAITPDSAAAAPEPWLDSTRAAAEAILFLDAAKAAWTFADRNYVGATGFIRPFDFYALGTMWDLASGLAALFCARELGLLEPADYERRMAKALATLKQVQLFDGISFNKEYDLSTGRMIGIEHTPSRQGYGISATDTGRLLLWLRIIAQNHPQFRPEIEAIVARIDFESLIEDGYLHGRQLSRRTRRVRSFQEGRIGYEQYAAAGFAAWGHRADQALDIRENSREKTISGVVLPTDRRGADRLTSEPFVLLGLEHGWPGSVRPVAERVLQAQQNRARETGRIVIVSEDAINIEPDYFFYYTILSRRGPWTIDVQRPGANPTGPRWVSTKAAFGWHAITPSDYTRQALEHVRTRALIDGTWGSGVFEDGRPTANPNINTAAVVLEAALYRQRGRPLLSPAPRS